MAHLRRPSLDSSASHESFAARLGGKVRDVLTPNLHADDDGGEERGRSFLTRGKVGEWEQQRAEIETAERDEMTEMLSYYLITQRFQPIRLSPLSDFINRSESRGREPIVSTGRGGAGNLRASSRTRSAYEHDVEDERRGRSSHATPPKAVHAGRGGVGNVRSPSRDPGDLRNQQAEQQLEARLQREAHEKAERDGMVPTGRGGAGNIRTGDSNSRSRSRSRTRDLLQRATSRDRSASRDVHAHQNNYSNSNVSTTTAPGHTPAQAHTHDTTADGDTSLAAVRE